jgi:branched-subunit amino acid ABC-type transport system permease component
MMLVALGLNFLTGYAGQVSLGHGALVAVGSYTTALLMVDAHWSFWASALAGMVVATAAGLVMALPALRLSTWYFALVTLTFAQVVTDLLVEWRGLTRGFSGIVGIPAPTIGAHSLGPVEVYLAVAASVVLAFLVTRNLTLSRFGRGMVAARDNPLAATASGVSLLRIKLFAFAVRSTVNLSSAGVFEPAPFAPGSASAAPPSIPLFLSSAACRFLRRSSGSDPRDPRWRGQPPADRRGAAGAMDTPRRNNIQGAAISITRAARSPSTGVRHAGR